MASLADTIRSLPFFNGLSREDLSRIAGKLEEETFRSGRNIVKQGDPGDALYVIQSGAAEVIVESVGVEESIAVLGANECFGEMALFTGQTRSATVRALTDTVVLRLSKENWDELLNKHPTLTLHFCRLLSRRLAQTDQSVAQERGAFNLLMEEFLTAQPDEHRDLLLRSSIMNELDLEAMQAVLSVSNPTEWIASLVSSYPMLFVTDQLGQHRYRQHLRQFLDSKFRQSASVEERRDLHLRFGHHFVKRGRWLAALRHYIVAEAWTHAVECIKAHGEKLAASQPPKEIRRLVEAIPAEVMRADAHLTRWRAKAYEQAGDREGAIRAYREFLAHRTSSDSDAVEVSRCYQDLAELYCCEGKLNDARLCLRMGATLLGEREDNEAAMEALRALERLAEKDGLAQDSVGWGSKTLGLAQKLNGLKGKGLFRSTRRHIGLVLAPATALTLWSLPPPALLDENGRGFLALLAAAVILWTTDVFDDYVVAILLLLGLLLLEIVPAPMALSGFSQGTWFFFFGVLAIAAAVSKSGLLYRAAMRILSTISPRYKNYTILLGVSGLLLSPMLPNITARVAIMSPISLALAESMGYKARSNGSAGLVFASFIGFSQVAFAFLTGATACLFGWNLLPEEARAEFGWTTWAIAALPAALFLLFFLIGTVHVLFPTEEPERSKLSDRMLTAQLELLGPLTFGERLGLLLLISLLAGLVSKPLHGISEAWITLGVLSGFLVTGLLDRKDIKGSIDWGFLLFFGVISALNEIVPHLRIDALMVESLRPVFSVVAFEPLAFLMVVVIIVYGVRLFLTRYPSMVLLMLALVPLAQSNGIHPGVLLLAILMAIDSWFLLYQTEYYQIAYYGTEERAFSHAQARKLMVAKLLGSLVAVAISVPYWKMLGFIR